MKTKIRNKKKHLLISLCIVCLFGGIYAQDSKPKPKVTPQPSVTTKTPAAKATSTTTDNKYGTVADIDGNVYKTVKIGNQIWMAENLKTTLYNDGTPIPMVTDNNEWGSLQTGAFCFFNNNKSNSGCGNLYNWYAVNAGKLAPQGWHVPTDEDWSELFTYLGGTDVAGKKMKSKKGWAENGNGTNESGFSGSPCNGYRAYFGGGFAPDKWSGTYWYSTSGTTYQLHYSRDDVIVDKVRSEASYVYGYTIRCIKD